MGVVMFEALFFLGAFVTMIFHFIGVRPGAPVRIATLLGASFVAWSNISYGLEYGRGGVVIGVAIILCAIVAEAVAGKAILHTGSGVEEGGETSTSPAETSTTKLDTSTSSTRSSSLDVEDMETPSTGRGEVEKSSPPKLEIEAGDLHVSSAKEVKESPPAHSLDVEKVEKVEEAKSGDVEVEKLESGNRSTLHPGDGEKKSPPSTSRKKSTGKSSISTLETGEISTISYNAGDDPLEVALEIMKVEKRRPGRPRLMKAGMSEHTAKMTANKLKKLEQKAS
jgi:hypothetical protein